MNLNSKVLPLLIFGLVTLIIVTDAFAYSPVTEINFPYRRRSTSTSPKYLLKLNVKGLDGDNQTLNINLYNQNNSKLIQSVDVDGFVSLPSNSSNVDLESKFDNSNLIFLTKNLSLKEINSTLSDLIVDYTDPTVPGLEVYRAYAVKLPDNFKFSSIDLKIKYNDLPVYNENNLILKKCGNFDLNSSSCLEEWSNVTITINKESKFVSVTINSFSVYALGENSESGESTTTTTTTIPNTTTTTSSSSSSSSGSSGSSDYTPSTTTTTTTTRPTTTLPTTTITTTKENSTNGNNSKDTKISTFSSQSILPIVIYISAGCVALFLGRRYYLQRMNYKPFHARSFRNPANQFKRTNKKIKHKSARNKSEEGTLTLNL